MITAARDAAKTRQPAPPPPELTLAWHCRRWQALPEPGGLLDQPAGLLERMAVVEDVYDALYAFNRLVPGTGAQWVDRNPRAWEIVQQANGWIKQSK